MTTTTKTDKATILALSKAVSGGDLSTMPILLDKLNDCGFDTLLAYFNGLGKYHLRQSGLGDKVKDHLTALELHETLAKIDLLKVPVQRIPRAFPRKDRAALLRRLFKTLAITGVGVTTPTYSMARTVDIKIPRRCDHVLLEDDGSLSRDDPARVANYRAEQKIEAILLVAFPNHDDRSDSSSDYFDDCWHVN